eukprot:4007951-Pleurochrysis_carterae.AAC.1
MSATYSQRVDHCCCSAQCPKITTVVFVRGRSIFVSLESTCPFDKFWGSFSAACTNHLFA